MSLTIKDIANNINQKSKEYRIGDLQTIRKEIKKLTRKANSQIFNYDTISDEGWAFHYGGRKELQFNIGFEEEGLRYGVAFSLETSQTLPDINFLRPKINKLNSIIQENPELFLDYKMWYWRGIRSEITDVKKISSSIIKNGTFIFIGKLMNIKQLDYNEILQTFDNLLDVYIAVEKEETIFSIQKTKTCVLKPVMWNTNNYTGPSGFKSAGGFSKDNGYGHEEWNNDSNWIWRNFKIFHTESKPKLLEYSKDGMLGIVMIAAFEKNQYAVGIATNVFYNDSEERDLIAHELNIYANHKQVWQHETVKNAFDNNERKFIAHWEKNYKWIQWKCPIENYHWFEKPVLLNPQDISGKEKLISMHGSYQRILPQLVLKTLYNDLKEKPNIIEWLTNGEFDTEWVEDKSNIKSNSTLRKQYSDNGANAPATKSFSYWIEGQRNIDPLHAILQAKFVNYLSKHGIIYVENKDYIDVQYKVNCETYFCEIKPTQNLDSKYAIRIAVGQLLEYQYFFNNTAKLEIVLSSRPKNREMEFVKSLNIMLTYYNEKTNEFITE